MLAGDESGNETTRVGVWFDDDHDFIGRVAAEFESRDGYQLHVREDPFSADWFIRRVMPHFVVFDLRWQARKDRGWFGNPEEGLAIINQVRSLFGNRDQLLWIVVSDLALTYKEALESFEDDLIYYNKEHLYENIPHLCDIIIDHVEEKISSVPDGRERYLGWCRVCADVPEDELDFIGKRIEELGLPSEWPSPVAWKSGLDELVRRAQTTCDNLLGTWKPGEDTEVTPAKEDLRTLYNYAHARTEEHGRSIYTLCHRSGAIDVDDIEVDKDDIEVDEDDIDVRELDEPGLWAMKQILQLCGENSDLSKVEVRELDRLLAVFKSADRFYEGRIEAVAEDSVTVSIEGLVGKRLMADMKRSVFPPRRLYKGMEFRLEARVYEDDIVLLPRVFSPSTVPIDRDALSRMESELEDGGAEDADNA